MTLSISSKESKSTDYDSRKYVRKKGMLLAARCMKLFHANKERTEPSDFYLESRIHLLHFLSGYWICIYLTRTQTINSKCCGVKSFNVCCNVSHLKFDCSMLKLQQPLLERTLNHPNPTISEPTISFWNSTYGEQIKLDFPQKLLPVLDKLYKSGKIKLCNRTCHMEDSINRPQRRKVITTLNKCSKRVENIGNPTYGSQQDFDKLNFSTKRKQSELTECQREVRREQQGRARDCNGHDPGIRTYTAVDFSQGNEESQDNEGIRDSESIFKTWKKVCWLLILLQGHVGPVYGIQSITSLGLALILSIASQPITSKSKT